MADEVRCIVVIMDTGAATVHQLAHVTADRCRHRDPNAFRSSIINHLNSSPPPVVVATNLGQESALKLGEHLEGLGATVDIREQQGVIRIGPLRY